MITNARSSEGFSLIELMTALVIIALALLALSSVLVYTIRINVANDLRNTTVRLMSHTGAALLALPFDAVRSCGLTADPGAPNYDDSYRYDSGNDCLNVHPHDYLKYPNPIQTINGFRQRFNITWDVMPLGDDLRQITIRVSYNKSNEEHVHRSVLFRHRNP